MRFSKRALVHYGIALVWFLNGFYCKLLNLVPRHQLIVERILGDKHAFLFTKLIGISEVMMSLWVLSRWKSRICAWFQVILILTMNTIELIKAPDLLLFGHGNAVLAGALVFVILYNEYYTGKKSPAQLRGGEVET